MSQVDSQPLYKDGGITLTATTLTIEWFWFPSGSSKVINISDIKGFKTYKPRGIFQMKGWGMGIDFEVWWHCDLRRSLGDKNAIVIDTGSWPKIGISPGSGNLSAVNRVEQLLHHLLGREGDSDEFQDLLPTDKDD